MFRSLLALGGRRNLAELVIPRRTFEDVILPASTRRALTEALVQIDKRSLLFEEWGLGERHDTGLGLALHFAGPPGTGKTICAEAVANALGRPLLEVRYAEMESLWAGESGKNVAAVFREAREREAVLFFDEADAIATRRFGAVSHGYEREANQTVNILLEQLESFAGVVIFATNLAANLDPAFERRIRTHILFEMPDADDRERIWRVQVHPTKTPLAPDVDFGAIARRYPASGGEIQNALLKAAQAAAAEAGDDRRKAIRQAHLVAGIESVLSGRRVMEQSLFAEEARPDAAPDERRRPVLAWRDSTGRWVLLSAALLLLAAGGFLGWASVVVWHWLP